ncbi:hypothetical protein [Roseivivax sp. CAU 1753]
MTDRFGAIGSALHVFFGPELRVWRGTMPLGVAFWLHGVLASWAIAMLYATAVDLGQTVLQQVLLILALFYTVWIIVGIWRCSANAAPFWGSVARWMTVAWAINSTLLLVFLQLDLLVRHAQG